ncbi:MAG: hypothetical protein ACKOEO_16390, partial [Planctomycetaceae bacterium]
MTRIFTNHRSTLRFEIRSPETKALIRINSCHSWSNAQHRRAGIQIHESLESSRIIAAPCLLKSDHRK